MTVRRLFATALAFLLAGTPAPARPEMLGVVVEAYRAHLNTGEVSAGTTVYDGDQFSTEEGGTLRLKSDAAMLDLAEMSRVIVGERANAAKETEATLIAGTVVFSTPKVNAIEIEALRAGIRAVADRPTVGEVGIVGPKELRVYARRGDLLFSYRGETEIIEQGKTYRVVLDPPEDNSKKEQPAKHGGRRRKAFLLIGIGGGGVGLGRLLHEAFESRDRPESPDRP